MNTNRRNRLRGAFAPAALVAAGAVVLAGCDLGVFDAGSIEDPEVDNPNAIEPMVIGAERAFGRATTGQRPAGSYGAGAFLTDETVHSGQFVGMRDWSDAAGVPDDVAETQSRWAHAQNSRFTAEEAVNRISGILEGMGEDPQSNIHIARATLWAGFSNRLLGDTFCDAVIDGGPLEPHTEFFVRAEGQFTEAIAIATTVGNDSLVTAGHAGRAQTRMMLGDWSGAVEDADMVDIDYVHEMRHSDNASIEHNGLHNLHMRDTQASVWGTPFAQWGTVTNWDEVQEHADDLSGLPDPEGDPRVPYEITLDIDDDDGTASYATDGDPVRPDWQLQKYTSRNDNVPIAKGTEMRLIEAEAALNGVGGDAGTAIELINEVRAFHGLDPVSLDDDQDAWFLLQKERGIELWVEGRRLADMRRWMDTPGNADFEVVRLEQSGGFAAHEVRNVLDNPDMPNNELCLPINRNERDSNPNID